MSSTFFRKAIQTPDEALDFVENILESSTEYAIVATDLDGTIALWNEGARRIYGYRAEEVVGKANSSLLHAPENVAAVRPKDLFVAAVRDEKWEGSVECVCRNGERFTARVVVTPRLGPAGRLFGFLLISRNISEEIKLTEEQTTERRRLERRMEQVNRISSLGRMASTIAHEFNNVLMGIQPFAELIRRRAGEDIKVEQAASQILNSVNRGKSVTQDILRMTRSPEPRLQSIDVTQWLAQLATDFRATAGAIEIFVRTPPPGTLFARFDPNQMQQVITNLANNARDAMVGSGKLTMSAAKADNAVRIVIADTGCGIPPETVPFIFEPLFTTKRSATGLGLAVAQQLVLRNGGTIGVESTVGVGTQFEIDLQESLPVISTLPGEDRFSPQDF